MTKQSQAEQVQNEGEEDDDRVEYHDADDNVDVENADDNVDDEKADNNDKDDDANADGNVGSLQQLLQGVEKLLTTLNIIYK